MQIAILVPLDKLQSGSLANLHMAWTAYHSGTASFSKNPEKRDVLTYFQDAHRLNHLNRIIFRRHNCSDDQLLHCTFHIREVDSGKRIVKDMKFTPTIGAQYGIRYCIIKGLAEEEAKRSVFALFHPFTIDTWIGILVTFCLALWLLWKLRVEHFAEIFFWLGSTLLEQGDEGNRLKFRLSWFILISWLYLGFFVRNMYTFSMYSDITSQPVPGYLPDTIFDLFNTSLPYSDLKVVTGFQSYKESIFYAEFSNRRPSINPYHLMESTKGFFRAGLIHEIKRRSLKFDWLQKGRVENNHLFQLAKNNEIDTVRLEKGWVFGIETEYTRAVYNLRNEFVLVFDSQSEDRFACPVVGMLTGRIIYENSELALFTGAKLLAWQYDTFFTQFAVDSLKRLIESGIFEFVKILYETRTMFGSVNYFLENGFVSIATRKDNEDSTGLISSFTFANLWVNRKRAIDEPNNNDVRLGHHLQRSYSLTGTTFNAGGNFKPAKMYDTIVIWKLLLFLLTGSLAAFIVEACFGLSIREKLIANAVRHGKKLWSILQIIWYIICSIIATMMKTRWFKYMAFSPVERESDDSV